MILYVAYENKLCNRNLSRSEVTKIIIDYLQNVNAKRGTNNCFLIARRVLAILRDGLQEKYKAAVSTKATKHKFMPAIRGVRIVTSHIKASAIPELSGAITEAESTGMELRDTLELDENGNLIQNYFEATSEKESLTEKSSIRFIKACNENFIETLRNLPKDKYGRSYGIVLYTHPPKGNDFTIGHTANFYIDANNEVYFIDVQDHKHPECWVQSKPAGTEQGYIADVFYAPYQFSSKEQLTVIKEEPSVSDEHYAALKEEPSVSSSQHIGIKEGPSESLKNVQISTKDLNSIEQEDSTSLLTKYLYILKYLYNNKDPLILAARNREHQFINILSLIYPYITINSDVNPNYHVWEKALCYLENSEYPEIRQHVETKIVNLDLNAKDDCGCTALLYSAYHGDLDSIRIFFDYSEKMVKKINVNLIGDLHYCTTKHGSLYTPILIAARNKHLDVVIFLLRKFSLDLDLTVKGHDGLTVRQHLENCSSINNYEPNSREQTAKLGEIKMLLDQKQNEFGRELNNGGDERVNGGDELVVNKVLATKFLVSTKVNNAKVTTKKVTSTKDSTKANLKGLKRKRSTSLTNDCNKKKIVINKQITHHEVKEQNFNSIIKEREYHFIVDYFDKYFFELMNGDAVDLQMYVDQLFKGLVISTVRSDKEGVIVFKYFLQKIFKFCQNFSGINLAKPPIASNVYNNDHISIIVSIFDNCLENNIDICEAILFSDLNGIYHFYDRCISSFIDYWRYKDEQYILANIEMFYTQYLRFLSKGEGILGDRLIDFIASAIKKYNYKSALIMLKLIVNLEEIKQVLCREHFADLDYLSLLISPQKRYKIISIDLLHQEVKFILTDKCWDVFDFNVDYLYKILIFKLSTLYSSYNQHNLMTPEQYYKTQETIFFNFRAKATQLNDEVIISSLNLRDEEQKKISSVIEKEDVIFIKNYLQKFFPHLYVSGYNLLYSDNIGQVNQISQGLIGSVNRENYNIGLKIFKHFLSLANSIFKESSLLSNTIKEIFIRCLLGENKFEFCKVIMQSSWDKICLVNFFNYIEPYDGMIRVMKAEFFSNYVELIKNLVLINPNKSLEEYATLAAKGKNYIAILIMLKLFVWEDQIIAALSNADCEVVNYLTELCFDRHKLEKHDATNIFSDTFSVKEISILIINDNNTCDHNYIFKMVAQLICQYYEDYVMAKCFPEQLRCFKKQAILLGNQRVLQMLTSNITGLRLSSKSHLPLFKPLSLAVNATAYRPHTPLPVNAAACHPLSVPVNAAYYPTSLPVNTAACNFASLLPVNGTCHPHPMLIMDLVPLRSNLVSPVTVSSSNNSLPALPENVLLSEELGSVELCSHDSVQVEFEHSTSIERINKLSTNSYKHKM